MYAWSEDALGKHLLGRILAQAGQDLSAWKVTALRGKGELRKKLPQLMRLSANHDVILVTDLDDEPCAGHLIEQWLRRNRQPPRLQIRVAVRAAESWVLADRAGVSRFLNVPIATIPRAPDDDPRPKQQLLRLAERSSRRALRQDIVTRRDGQLRQSLNYNAVLADFVINDWNIRQAITCSPSLARAVRRLSATLAATS